MLKRITTPASLNSSFANPTSLINSSFILILCPPFFFWGILLVLVLGIFKAYLLIANAYDNLVMTTWTQSEIPSSVYQNWQMTLDLLADVCQVPAALIMRIMPEEIEVFAKSSSEKNPYKVGETESLKGELYCERVLQTDAELLVPNARVDQEWRNNPDVKLGMISYFGVPIHRSNGEPFGTICILDNKENAYSETFRNLLYKFKDIIESSLQTLEQNEELRELTEKLRKTLGDKETMLGIASHDLRAPLCTVESLSELLSLECAGCSKLNEGIDFIENINRTTSEMRLLLENILEAEYLDSSKVALSLERFDFTPLIRECVSRHTACSEKKHQVVILELPDQLMVEGHRIKLSEVVSNLISNAIKYSPKNSEIRVTCENVSEETLTVHIDDEGPGFHPRDFEKMFGKFQRLTAAPTNGESTNGLGLFIVKRVADLHNGSIIATNRESKGARMSFSWPGLVAT